MSQQPSSIRQQINSTNAAFVAALQRGDSAAMAATYTEDAQLLPPGAPVISGKAAIQAFWQGALDMGVGDGVLETLELEVHGDTAWEMGQGVLKTKAGQAIDTAKYIVIWKQVNGTWKWHRDIYNSSQAAP
ncbi:MAG: DUF4440 domain-containing protein [Caldilineaceae bacterium]